MGEWKNGWYVVPYLVEWRDLDGLGHVNNAAYFTFFEIARTRYWFDLQNAAGYRPQEIEFIAARAECNFRQQLSMSEQLDLCVRIAEIRNSSFDFVYEIRRNRGGELAADGKVVVVLFDWEKNAKIAVSAELRERIERFQSR